MRMKNHMANHVESCRSTMFAESCEEVKTLLIQMCRTIEESMSRKARVIYRQMGRDYLIALNGELLQVSFFPAMEKQTMVGKQVKAEVAKLVQERE